MASLNTLLLFLEYIHLTKYLNLWFEKFSKRIGIETTINWSFDFLVLKTELSS